MNLPTVTFVRPIHPKKRLLGEEDQQRSWLEFTSKGVAEYLVVDSDQVIQGFPGVVARTPDSAIVWVILAYHGRYFSKLLPRVYQRVLSGKFPRERALVFHEMRTDVLQRILDDFVDRVGEPDLVMGATRVLDVTLSEKGGPLGPTTKNARRSHLRLLPGGPSSPGGGSAA